MCLKDLHRDKASAPSSVSTSKTTADPGNVNCTAFNTTDECCDTKLKGACIFLNCTNKENKTHEECHFRNYTISDVCKETSGADRCASSTVSPPTTTAAPGPCQISNMTECCSKKECIYLNCTKAANSSENYAGCISNTPVEKDKVCSNTSVIQNMCNATATTTPAPTTTASTKSDKTTTSSKVTTQSTAGPLKSTPSGQADDGSKQHFDAASFVGGIVLCLGIVAIIFFGCKFYKARTERNYHTL
ncbi:hypothetical protein ACJMK2_027921 [Sinanodonta woodiana]|uniref:Sialomucin core protein 24 n=1 Tax=Sinanodonta woodiana TaxID=1069815 RepID=A0ABD3X5G8_SINWO